MNAASAPERLTARELEVAGLVADGLTNAEVAAALFLSSGTVRKHLDNIFAKTGARNRTVLARQFALATIAIPALSSRSFADQPHGA
jgi:DNA-binding NarL/FixJ family response regulator